MIITKFLVEVPTKVELSDGTKRFIKSMFETEIQRLTFFDEISYWQPPSKVTVFDEIEVVNDMSKWRNKENK